MIAAAKQGPVNFAVCLGKDADSVVVLMDKRRSPDVLAREVKALGDTKKVLTGTISIDEREARISCVEKPPSGVTKQLKAFFKAIKVQFTPVFLDATGTVLPDDDETSGTQVSSVENTAAAEDPTALAGRDGSVRNANGEAEAEWQTFWAGAEPDILQAIALDGKSTKQFSALRDLALSRAAADQFEAALKAGKALVEILQKTTESEAGTAGAPDLKALVQRLGSLKARIAAIGTPVGGKLSEMLQKIVALVKTAPDQARAEADKLEAALDKLSSGPNISVRELGEVRLEWRPVRTNAGGEIARLKQAIIDEYKAIPEAGEKVDKALKTLDATISRLDDRLTDELDAVLNADDSKRPPLAIKARKTLGEYISFVDSDPIMQALDDNDILPDLSVTEPIREKLRRISAALGG